METHFHLVATSANISSEMRKMKSYTARCIVDYLKANGPEFLLEQLKFNGFTIVEYFFVPALLLWI